MMWFRWEKNFAEIWCPVKYNEDMRPTARAGVSVEIAVPDEMSLEECAARHPAPLPDAS